MKYFPIAEVKTALEALQPIDNKWFIIPLVLGANRVGSTEQVVISKPGAKGTGKFLRQFFDGRLIGLEPKAKGGQCNIRPGNTDARRANTRLLSVDYSDLWGKTYSQSGYGAMQNGLILKLRDPANPGAFQLADQFSVTLQNRLGPNFKFEHLLVWLYAFQGVPVSVNSWDELLKDFEERYTAPDSTLTGNTAIGALGAGFPDEYKSAFHVSNGIAWPTNFLSEVANPKEFQAAFVPELVTAPIKTEDLIELRDTLADLISKAFIELMPNEPNLIAESVVSGLQGCRRLFLYGEPGTGKTDLARLIGTAFGEVFGAERAHIVFAPIADSTSADKLVGFSTMDGTWVHGAVTQRSGVPSKSLLYSENDAPEVAQGRQQINVVVLDEANRRDIEELLVKFQAALDSESADPSSDDFRISLDNSGERRISPMTYVVMTGNSPREDSGRVIQSRPFKRRHNLLPVENAFRRVLAKPSIEFSQILTNLFNKLGPALAIDIVQRNDYLHNFTKVENRELFEQLHVLLNALDKHGIGISFGLMKKVLKTSATRYTLSSNFQTALDYGITEAVFPLMAGEEMVDGRTLKNTLDELPLPCKGIFPQFVDTASKLIRGPDTFGRVRPFL